jgi:hypothetical protein
MVGKRLNQINMPRLYAYATDALRDLRNSGIVPVKVLISANELQAWCLAHGKPVRADARAEFVLGKARGGQGAKT